MKDTYANKELWKIVNNTIKSMIERLNNHMDCDSYLGYLDGYLDAWWQLGGDYTEWNLAEDVYLTLRDEIHDMWFY